MTRADLLNSRVSWAAVAAALLLGSPAYAQAPTTTNPPVEPEHEHVEGTAEAEPLETAPTTPPVESAEIVVTGTSIRGVASTGSPTIGVGLEEMRQAGVATATEAARLLPQVLNLGADETRSSFTGGAQDAAANSTAINGVNLRGLGPESTLLLVNGRRIAPGGVIKALYDLNVIPANAIARMEVVTDGASAIYGADAVAGVVNLITRKRSEHIESYMRVGFGDNLDGLVLAQTLGHSWGSGGFFGAFEHNERSALSARDRSWASQDRRDRGGSDARSFFASPGNIVIGGVRYGLPAGNGIGVNPTQITTGNVNRFDEGEHFDLLPYQNRESFFLDLWQDVTPRLQVWAQGWYTTRDYSVDAPEASGSLVIPSTNPFFVAPAGVTPPLCPASVGAPAGARCVTVEYRFLAENPDPESEGDEQNWQAATGFEYDFGGGFRLSAYGDYSVSEGFQARQNVINNPALAIARLSTNPATAFNAFGDGTFNVFNNPQLVDLIVAERFTTAKSTQKDLAAKIDGPLFAFGGGEVRFAAGLEYHTQRFEQRLDATNTLASGAVATKLVDNKRDYYSLFGELFVPLFGSANALPGLQRLELSVAARRDDYSDFGATTNPKVGVIWSPFRDLILRGTYGTSFRAPSLVDTSPQIFNVFIQNLTDPASPTGTTRGIFMNGGNPDLVPEEAKTWSFGASWEPTFLGGLDLSVNYYRINYTNRIDVVPGTALTSPVYAQFAVRRPTDPAALAEFNARAAALLASPDLQSPIEPVSNINAIIDGRRQNLGTMKQDGIDVSAGYSFGTGMGDIELRVDWSEIFNLERKVAPTAPFIDVLDTFGNPVDRRIRGTAIWDSGPVNLATFVNYVDGYTNTAITPNVDVDSYTTVDATVTYDLESTGVPGFSGTRVALSIQDLFDENPPVVLNGTASYDLQNINPLGRFISLQLTKKW